MLWLGIDFETTGLNRETDRITEIGVVLWEAQERVILSCLSTFVWDDSYPEYTKEALALMDCSLANLKKHSMTPGEAFNILLPLVQKADFLVGHNAKNFDKLMFEAELSRQRKVLKDPMHWIDSSVDVPYPDKIATRKLVHLAAEHKFLNPYAHRAVTDVLTMLTIMSQYDPNLIARLSVEEDMLCIANVSYDDRDKAKERGYRWNGSCKRWEKLIKESLVVSEQQAAPFKIHVIREQK